MNRKIGAALAAFLFGALLATGGTAHAADTDSRIYVPAGGFKGMG